MTTNSIPKLRVVIFYCCFLSAQQLIQPASRQMSQNQSLAVKYPKRTLGISFPRIWVYSLNTISTTSTQDSHHLNLFAVISITYVKIAIGLKLKRLWNFKNRALNKASKDFVKVFLETLFLTALKRIYTTNLYSCSL